jgi:hypothetical protein
MKCKNFAALSGFAAALLISLAFTASGQTQNDSNIANVVGGGSAIRWEVGAPNSGGTLTITFPDGRAVRKTVKAGASPQIGLGEKYFENLPDGNYTYELQLAPVMSRAQREALQKARGKDDDPESDRATRKAAAPSMLQSGSFAVVNGSIITAGAVEPDAGNGKPTIKGSGGGAAISGQTMQRLKSHHFALFKPDFVIADDLIVQGSACVGLDCVDGENFGFDTIRMKENNTRLQYDDTSTSAGFPSNNWQIRANSSASGGGNFLAFVDQGTTGNSETGTIVFEVDAGAPANSLRVSSGGNVGIGTATPVLDVHVNTTDTPAIRLEQNNSGGFTAQTWDVAGNEANFFVRDVTSGSRLPFRIRPGAATSSIDIAANSNVGIGTASPTRAHLEINQSSAFNGSGGLEINAAGVDTGLAMGADATNNLSWIQSLEPGVSFTTRPLTLQPNGGNVGIGTTAPTQNLSVNGTAGKPGGGTWDVFSDERLKNIKGRYNTGLRAVMQLQPLRYEYKPDNALGIKLPGEQIGFGAQAVQKVIPEAVTKDSSGYLMVKSDPIIWTMLNAIQEQQKQIAVLKAQVRRLSGHSRRHRK